MTAGATRSAIRTRRRNGVWLLDRWTGTGWEEIDGYRTYAEVRDAATADRERRASG